MREWLVFLTERAIVLIDALAMIVIVAGTLLCVVAVFRVWFSSERSHADWNDVWIHYARWLVAGLTFQLAADVIETSITTSWEAVGRLGAVAVIRTFLNYFLAHDFEEARRRDAVERERGLAAPLRPAPGRE